MPSLGEAGDTAMTASYRPVPGVIEAHRWLVNGDHPGDGCRMISPDPGSARQFTPFQSEGRIVRYYRNPGDDGQRECGDCGNRMHDHGWIDSGIRGRVVCPGDWIISLPAPGPGLPARFPVKPDVLAATWTRVPPGGKAAG
jgi:hypothetical protein